MISLISRFCRRQVLNTERSEVSRFCRRQVLIPLSYHEAAKKRSPADRIRRSSRQGSRVLLGYRQEIGSRGSSGYRLFCGSRDDAGYRPVYGSRCYSGLAFFADLSLIGGM